MARYFTIINGRRQYINPTDVNAIKNQRAGNTVNTTGMTAAGRQILANTTKSTPATGLSYAGGGGGGSAANMKAEWQAAYDKARAANKARENEIRQKYKDRYSAVMQGLEGMGEQTRKDILERGKRREGEAQQSAISRGLAMGTVVDSLQNSVREGTDRSLGQLDESLRNTKLGYESSLRKEEADFLERITDQYPDQRMYAGMFEKYGQGVAGSGETGMGGGVGSSSYGGNRPMGIGHAFYTGTNPYTGLAETQKTLPGSKNYWSNRTAASDKRNRMMGSFRYASSTPKKKERTSTRKLTIRKPVYGPKLPDNYMKTTSPKQTSYMRSVGLLPYNIPQDQLPTYG